MLAVEILQHVELIALLFGREFLIEQIFDGLALDVVDIQAGVADGRALERSGEKRRAPVLGAAVRKCGFDSDESGQILVLAAKTVEHPRAHAGPRERAASGEGLQERRAVIDSL